MATKKAFVQSKQLLKDAGLLVSSREERRKAERKAKKLKQKKLKQKRS